MASSSPFIVMTNIFVLNSVKTFREMFSANSQLVSRPWGPKEVAEIKLHTEW